MSVGRSVVQLNPDGIALAGISTQTAVGSLLQRNVDRMIENAKKLSGPVPLSAGGTKLTIRFKEGLDLTDAKLTLETNESYVLQVATVDGQVTKAKTSDGVE